MTRCACERGIGCTVTEPFQPDGGGRLMNRRCPLHDEHVDPDTGHCDACQRDARLDCTWCDGEGVIYTRHPDWGRPWCPDDYIETPCGQCGEGGAKMAPVECESCRKELDHDDPSWVVEIVQGQRTPLCVECAETAGYAREGIQ